MMDYIDSLIAAHRAGHVRDHIHLGLVANSVRSLDEAQEAMTRHHLMHLAVQDGHSVVDVGCGFGGSLRMIDAGHAAQMTGVNIDPRQIAIARQGAWRNPVDWMTCDAAAFSRGRTAWADRILALEAMFHFPDPAGFLQAAAQALRPGGRVVVSTILLASHADHAASVTAVCQGFAPWPHPELTMDGLFDMTAAAGLMVLHSQDLASQCLAGFDWMCPPPPPFATAHPVIELRRLFQAGGASYPLVVLVKPQAGGKTQK